MQKEVIHQSGSLIKQHIDPEAELNVRLTGRQVSIGNVLKERQIEGAHDQKGKQPLRRKYSGLAGSGATEHFESDRQEAAGEENYERFIET